VRLPFNVAEKAAPLFIIHGLVEKLGGPLDSRNRAFDFMGQVLNVGLHIPFAFKRLLHLLECPPHGTNLA
jgi:hypothetical protein